MIQIATYYILCHIVNLKKKYPFSPLESDPPPVTNPVCFRCAVANEVIGLQKLHYFLSTFLPEVGVPKMQRSESQYVRTTLNIV